jgi:UDP-N-acetylglucosamine--N-acetylmuramyl-(pentapeptide) pyrophosphoryl-undecaprenol N-acetylglucosamine transferase
VIAAGGTGGHIFLGVALAREIQALRPEAEILFIGSRHGLEVKLVPQTGFPLDLVRSSGFAGKSAVKKLGALADVPVGFLEARRILARSRARAVAGVGGYVSVPVVLAARSLGVPTLIHESNAFPGVANRLLNRFATRTAVGVAPANSHLARPGVVTGTPVRPEFFRVPPLDPASATRRLLVFGGSQGSRVLNRSMVEAAPLLATDGIEVIHQAGEKEFESVRAAYGNLPPGWRLEPFLPRIHEELAWADIVLSRAGSQTLAELAAAGRPSILVPFGSATHGHQTENARAFERAQAAIAIEEGTLTGETLARTVRELVGNRSRLVEMGENARAFARPDAAKILADLLFEAERTR